MATSFPMANPWSDGESLNAAKLYARITQAMNDLAALTSDTGWVNLTAGAGITNNGAMVRRIGDMVFYTGTLAQSGGWASVVTAYTLPDVKFAPKTSTRLVMPGFSSSASAPANILYLAAGSTTVQVGPFGAASGTLYLDAMQYLAA